MIISEKPYCRKVTAKKMDDNTFEFVEVCDLSHPECPIVLVGGSAYVLNVSNTQQSEELKVIE